MIASVIPLFGAERTFERPREGLIERWPTAVCREQHDGTMTGGIRGKGVFRGDACKQNDCRFPCRCKRSSRSAPCVDLRCSAHAQLHPYAAIERIN